MRFQAPRNNSHRTYTPPKPTIKYWRENTSLTSPDMEDEGNYVTLDLGFLHHICTPLLNAG